jgi:hypothetical protein
MLTSRQREIFRLKIGTFAVGRKDVPIMFEDKGTGNNLDQTAGF